MGHEDHCVIEWGLGKLSPLGIIMQLTKNGGIKVVDNQSSLVGTLKAAGWIEVEKTEKPQSLVKKVKRAIGVKNGQELR